MAKVEEPIQEPPRDVARREDLEGWLEDARRKMNSQGDAVTNAGAIAAIVTTETATGAYTANEQSMLDNLKTDVTNLKGEVTDLKTQLNALLDEMRDAGNLARS